MFSPDHTVRLDNMLYFGITGSPVYLIINTLNTQFLTNLQSGDTIATVYQDTSGVKQVLFGTITEVSPGEMDGSIVIVVPKAKVILDGVLEQSYKVILDDKYRLP